MVVDGVLLSIFVLDGHGIVGSCIFLDVDGKTLLYDLFVGILLDGSDLL
jgi:hypothetical protein